MGAVHVALLLVSLSAMPDTGPLELARSTIVGAEQRAAEAEKRPSPSWSKRLRRGRAFA